MVQNPAVTYPRPGFVEIELQRLDESVRCHTCGATVNEVRVMERRTSKATVSCTTVRSVGSTSGETEASEAILLHPPASGDIPEHWPNRAPSCRRSLSDQLSPSCGGALRQPKHDVPPHYQARSL
jgi:hypothetical protein